MRLLECSGTLLSPATGAVSTDDSVKFNERLLIVSSVKGMSTLPVVELVLKYFKASMPGAPTAADMANKLGFKMAQVEKLVMQGFLRSPNRRYGINSRE